MKLLSLGVFALLLASAASAQEPQIDKEDLGLNLFDVASGSSCIHGHNPFAPGTTERVRGLAEATMASYIALAGSGTGADATSVYTIKKHTLGWKDGRLTNNKIEKFWAANGRNGQIFSIDDPIARTILAAGTDTIRHVQVSNFFIAGAKLNAMGLWRVSDPLRPGETIGWYKARFMRQNSLGNQSWNLISLELTQGATPPAPIRQFCYEPGDVEANWAWEKEKKEKREKAKAAKRL